MSQYDLLTGKAEDTFVSAKARYGTWPTTVWPHVRGGHTEERALLEQIGDEGQARDGAFGGSGCYDISASIFSPAVAAWVLNLYAPHEGTCFDPFAGGGTRAIMAAKHGLRYEGCEVRAAEVEAVRRRCTRCAVPWVVPGLKPEAGQVDVRWADARHASRLFGTHTADFCYTCPPYYNLEEYNGGAADLSMLPSYGAFLAELGKVIAQCREVLRLGVLSVWVVGHLRGRKGELLPLNHDVARLHQQAGFRLREEVIIHHQGGAAVQRTGNFDRGARPPSGYLESSVGFLIRVHEYALVFENTGEVPNA